MSLVLDPLVADLLEEAERAGLPPWNELTPAEAREQYLTTAARLGGDRPAVATALDTVVPRKGGSIPVRVYKLDDTGSSAPLVVYYHGGGWVIGNLDSHDNVCRALCRAARAVVVSVDYRLAPEHKFPAAVDDAWSALTWAAAHAAELGADAARLAVAGDSAGGTLAAVMAHMARDAGSPVLRHQVLIYPVTDLTLSMPSMDELGEGYRLTRPIMQWFVDHYVRGDADRRDPRGSPLAATDLAGLASATVITAGFDPLRDEGKAYAERLHAAGVETTHHLYEGMIHGFVNLAGRLPHAREAIGLVGSELQRALA